MSRFLLTFLFCISSLYSCEGSREWEDRPPCMVNTCPQPLKCLQATGSEAYDKNFLRECQGLNPQEKVKCVFELTYEKEKPCLPCVCQNICNLDRNLCKYCTCPQPQKCLEITRTLLQECHGLNPAETIKCVFGKIINEVTPCIPCASRILSEFSRRQVPGFIITGGDNSASEKRLEIFNPISRHACPLPYLPKKMLGHSQCGNHLCKDKSCLKMSSRGSFSPVPVSLLQSREAHLCWSLPGGGGDVMLLGGYNSPNTTEVISSNFNSTKPSWNLKYKTDDACGVEVDDTFIITGGFDFSAPDRALNSVVSYNSQGESEVLPSLTVRRYNHACASYLNGDRKRIILVSGGWNNGAQFLDSTELMVNFKPWRPAANLPSPRFGLRAASLDNKVFLFGGSQAGNRSASYLNSILSYEPDTDTWQEAGTMTLPRRYHAVTVFPDVSQLCP